MPLQDSDLFLVTKADGSESRHIRADNLFSGIADDWVVLVDENGISKRCVVGDLRYKASDDRYMLVNVVDKSYKVKSSTVVSQYAGPPPPVPISSTFTYSISARSSGVAATFDKTFTTVPPTPLEVTLPIDARTVVFNVPMQINPGSTLIVALGMRPDAVSSLAFSLSDSQGNTYESVIQGTQENSQTNVTIFKADINTTLSDLDTLTWSANRDLKTSKQAHGILYVIDEQGVSVVDTDDFRTPSRSTSTVNIDAKELTVALTGHPWFDADNPVTCTNPDFTYIDIMNPRQSGTNIFSWYLVGTELGNGNNPTVL